jgi:hypothetical protein
VDFFEYTDDEIYALAKPIIESMNDGTNNNDYKLFSTYFSSRMLDLVGEDKFTKQTEANIPEYGELDRYSFLGCIRRESGVTVVYRQNTKKKKGELLGQLLLDDENGEIKVVYAGIQ